jgi:hypothetical protein
VAQLHHNEATGCRLERDPAQRAPREIM